MSDKAVDVALIAKVAHEANRAYCTAIGDDSQPPWDQAPDWQRDSAIKGVEAHLASDLTPQESHEAWLEHKRAEGWTYGEVKNADLKQHPCFVPYAELPIEQRAKDYIFAGVVRALADQVAT